MAIRMVMKMVILCVFWRKSMKDLRITKDEEQKIREAIDSLLALQDLDEYLKEIKQEKS